MHLSNIETLMSSLFVASGGSSMSKAKSQTFDPFADLGNLGSNLPGMKVVVIYKQKNAHFDGLN